ncbi:MAG: hypothetical protein R3351_01710 [Nitrospirales bacterium]|nr:hypothetical protein [Nitrospirales bacterium]
MKTFFVGALIVGIGLGGCATKPKISEEEMKAAMTRTYQGVSSGQVMKASEKLLKMVDEKRFQFKQSGNQLTATRSGELFTNIGKATVTAVWIVNAQEMDNSTVVTLEAGWKRQSLSSGVTGRNVKKPQGTAVYTLFFNRLDNLLGKSNEWMTCEGMEKAIKQGEAFGDIRMLCAYADDKLPGSS